MLLIALCLLCKDTKFFVEIQIIMEEFFNYLFIPDHHHDFMSILWNYEQ